MNDLQIKLNELFEYQDGNLFWKVNRGSQKCKGKIAGTKKTDGYIQTRVRELGSPISNHRIIWCMHYGEMPEYIDHINGNRSDNRLDNLRPATKIQNGQNRKMPKHNTTGVKNVTWLKDRNKYGVFVNIDGRKKLFGTHKDLELAELVAYEVREKYHREYAKHN